MESDPKLARFIMDLRTVNEEEAQKIILKHRVNMAKYHKLGGEKAVEFHLKNFYLISKGFHVTEVDFLKAVASHDLYVKRLGYLGATFMKNLNLHLSIIDFLKKDLLEENSGLSALNFLGCVNTENEEFRLLLPLLKELSITKKIKEKAIIIYQKIRNSILNTELNEINEKIAFIKLQILLDRFDDVVSNEEMEFISNSKTIGAIFNLYNFEKFHIKLKCVQLLHMLVKNNVKFDESFINKIEESITVTRLLKKSMGEVSLLLDSVKLLLKLGRNNQKIQTFVFKLIESKSEILMYEGIKLAYEHDIYYEIALDRLISLGLSNPNNYSLLLKMINKTNFEKVFDKREEIILKLESKDLTDEKIQKIIDGLISKILTFAQAKDVKNIFFMFPLFCLRRPVKNYLTQAEAIKIFEELKDKQEPDFFCLLYQSVYIGEILDRLEYSKLIEHLEIVTKLIIKEKSIFYLPDLLDFILSMLISYEKLTLNTQTLLKNIFQNQYFLLTQQYKAIFIENILVCNLFAPKKSIYIGDNIFLEYEFEIFDDKKFLKIYKLEGCVINVIQSKRLKGDLDNEFSIKYLVHCLEDVKVEVIKDNFKYTAQIYND